MCAGYDQQPLSYAIRLPDEAQEDALRLLDSSRAVVNAALFKLWPQLDDFLQARTGPAWKRVMDLIDSPDPHGSRQWRCEAETVGRIMRGQAERKQVFALIQLLLSDGFIRPKTKQQAAGKNRKSIKEGIEALQKTLEDDATAFVTMQSVVEQACNYFLAQEHSRKSTRTCRLCLCSKWGRSGMQGMMGWRKGKVIVSPSVCKPGRLRCSSAFLMSKASGSGASESGRSDGSHPARTGQSGWQPGCGA